MTRPASAARRLVLANLGLILWAVGFSALYGLSALACVYGWPRILLVAVWLGFLAANAWVLWRALGAAPPLRFLTRATALAGFVALLWTGGPVVSVSLCQ